MQIESSSELPVVVYDLSTSENSKINILLSDYYLTNKKPTPVNTSITNIIKTANTPPPIKDNFIPFL